MRLSIAYFISYSFINSGSGGQHSAVLASLRWPLKLAQHTQPLPQRFLPSSPAHEPSVLNQACVNFKSRVRVAIQANSTPQLEEYDDASKPHDFPQDLGKRFTGYHQKVPMSEIEPGRNTGWKGMVTVPLPTLKVRPSVRLSFLLTAFTSLPVGGVWLSK